MIITSKTNLSDLSTWLPLVDNLNKAMRDKFILAARFYQQALEMIETATDMAYINLVSAIETLCGDTDIGMIEMAKVDGALSNAIGRIYPPDLRKEIEERIIKREPFIKRRFVEFIKQHVDDSLHVPEQTGHHSGRSRPPYRSKSATPAG